MTGFGAAESNAGDVTIRVEARSVNHRHLDARFRPSTGAPALESTLLARLRDKIRRGHVDMRLTVRAIGPASALTVDLDKAAAIHAAVERIAEALSLPLGANSMDIANQHGVIETAPAHQLLTAHQELATRAFDEAIDGLVTTRLAEGERLAVDLSARISELKRLCDGIRELSGGQLERRRETLRERVTAALNSVGASVDNGRLEQELVHISDRVDVTEELVRLDGHLSAFDATLHHETAPGRKLGFLAQEILREINTIGSKSGDLAITQRVVEAKVEVEKVREQVLNLE